MDCVQRIFERFDDINDFAGYKPEKVYGWEYREKFEELGVEEELMAVIDAFQKDSMNEAYMDGFRFGMRFFMECVL